MSGRWAVMLGAILLAQPVGAQDAATPCRLFCAPEFKVEPTFTTTNLFGGAEIMDENDALRREPRELEFEVILSVDLPTRVRWLGLTVEAIFQPFAGDSTPELEFETNLTWLDASRTGGWVSSHADVVDKFSPSLQPSSTRAYTHKLNFELDTAFHPFNRLPDERWLHGVEIEGSLDYVATGLPRSGDRLDGVTYVDAAHPWSFSLVVVVPVAP